MRVKEMRELTADEMNGRIDETRKEIIDLRFQHAMRKLESTAKLSQARKRLSRLLTLQHEKKLGIR